MAELKYSVVTMVRGTEIMLGQTILGNLAKVSERDDSELIILSYNSSGDVAKMMDQHRGAMESGKLVYVEERKAPKLRLPHAKNVGARVAEGRYVVSLTADSVIGDEFFQCLDYDVDRRQSKLMLFGPGRLALERKLFDAVRGYDESFVGWGYEDQDLFDRARAFDSKCNASRRPLPTAHQLDQQMTWRNGPDTDAAGKTAQDTFKANQQRSQASLKAGKFVVNQTGYGQATVFVNFEEKGQVLQ